MDMVTFLRMDAMSGRGGATFVVTPTSTDKESTNYNCHPQTESYELPATNHITTPAICNYIRRPFEHNFAATGYNQLHAQRQTIGRRAPRGPGGVPLPSRPLPFSHLQRSKIALAAHRRTCDSKAASHGTSGQRQRTKQFGTFPIGRPTPTYHIELFRRIEAPTSHGWLEEALALRSEQDSRGVM